MLISAPEVVVVCCNSFWGHCYFTAATAPAWMCEFGPVPDNDFSSVGGLQPSSVLCRVWMHTPSALPTLGCGCEVTASGFVLKWIVDLVSCCGNIMLQ
ncbi:hypothetical protein Nepgr_014692 [Nepenthes gracilis]|uniref:Uncharacterized protein n=1 Tax=Nepenthes gracilis TaxID=150966 RepID=A0AAD3SMA6_NEPGR|nr:hypothetical protein Nepgr_014692 [Nepenthes gracilis]